MTSELGIGGAWYLSQPHAHARLTGHCTYLRVHECGDSARACLAESATRANEGVRPRVRRRAGEIVVRRMEHIEDGRCVEGAWWRLFVGYTALLTPRRCASRIGTSPWANGIGTRPFDSCEQKIKWRRAQEYQTLWTKCCPQVAHTCSYSLTGR